WSADVCSSDLKGYFTFVYYERRTTNHHVVVAKCSSFNHARRLLIHDFKTDYRATINRDISFSESWSKSLANSRYLFYRNIDIRCSSLFHWTLFRSTSSYS